MAFRVSNEGDTVIIALGEKIDFTSAPVLEDVIQENAAKYDKMVLDFAKVEYISSAGLRSILFADGLMSEKKGLSLRNVNPTIKEILDISGFTDQVEIE